MKICRNCNSKIENDALVCPYCGCVAKKGTKSVGTQSQKQIHKVEDNKPQAKRKTWLWVLGWIFLFPLPLTILMLRNQKLNKKVKFAIVVISWILYLIIATSGGAGSASAEMQAIENIKSLSFIKTDDVTVKVGRTASPGYLKVGVKSLKDFSLDDIAFVSENPAIATITLTDNNPSRTLDFDIAGISGGETNVYVISKDGKIKSEIIHVIVPEPIKVESIELYGYETELCLSQKTTAKATITPANAEDKTLTWASSDESVAVVDENGEIIAVGGGTATISVVANSGISSSIDVFVDGNKTLMKLDVRHPRNDNVDIGYGWSYITQINGEPTRYERGISVGETLSFYAKFTEDDKNPDIGTAQTTHTVTEDDIANGFEIAMDLYVTENGGKNRGKTAHFIVTYTFTPNTTTAVN